MCSRPVLACILTVSSVAVNSACVPVSQTRLNQLATSPAVLSRLQLVSAGHTGCVPDQNVMSNVVARADGSGTWNATCKAKVYFCSAVGSTSGSESFSCAPAVD